MMTPGRTTIELERRYRVLADVVVGVWALPELDGIEPTGRPTFRDRQSDAAVAARDDLAAQKRLLKALVRDRCALDAWLGREAVRHVLDAGLDRFRIDAAEEDLLAPVIASLPPPDREFFEEAVAIDEFCEWFDPFLNAVSANLVGVSVAERPRPLAKSNHALALKEYRVWIDVTVEVGAIDEADAQRTWQLLHERCGCEPEVTADRFVHLQSSLLSALRGCEGVLDLWLKQEVFRELVDYGDEPSLAEPDDRNILGPVIASLAPPDRARFEFLLQDGTLYEGARAFYRAVGASTREVSIAELPMRLAGRWR
jgi:hypothetical protein